MKYMMLMMVALPLQGWSTVTVGSENCPTAFQGTVKEIIEEVGPDNPFSLQKVIFEPHQIIKGDVGEKVIIDLLKNGPFKIEAGEDYQVFLRNGKLCWIEPV